MPSHPLYLANQPISTNADLPVLDKFTGKEFARVALADSTMISRAIEEAVKARAAMAQLASFEKAEILRDCLGQIEKRAEELAQVVCSEVGKPIRDARAEVSRLIDTFRITSEEATRL